MVRRRTKAKVSKSNKNKEDDLPAETGAAEIDVPKTVIVNASENNTLSQSEYKVQTAEEAEKENNAMLTGCSKVDNNTIDVDEDRQMHEEHAAEVQMELQGAKGEEGLEDYGNDDFNINDYNDDEFDEVEEGLCYNDDDNEDNVEVEDEDDGDDQEEEEEEDEEEEEIDGVTKLENNDNNVEEGGESQRNRVVQGEKEENAKKENKQRGGSLDKEDKTLGKRRERKKVREEVLDKVASKHEDRQGEDGQGDAMEEADQGNAKEAIQAKEGRSKQRVERLRKSRRKAAAGDYEKMTSIQGERVESSHRKKVKSKGMIFMCSSKTKKDCYHYKVLGLPANKRDVVGKIYKGMRLFLYDVDLKLLYGIYKAAGHGGYNIQPQAFNSQFPSQVRFTVLEDCLPLAEEKFRKVIKDNYFTKTKFDCQLSSQQVKNLCKLFLSTSNGSKAIRSARRVKTHKSTEQDRYRARHEERRSAVAEKHRYNEHSRIREREVVASPVAIRIIPPAAAPPSYVYDRTLELDAYRRDWFVEHRGSHRHPVAEPHLEQCIIYRRDPLLHQLDSYKQDVAAEHLGLRLQDAIGMRDPYISYRERPEHRELRPRDDFGRQDPYFSYRGSAEDHNLRPQDEFRRRDHSLSFREFAARHDRTYDPLPEPEHYRPINRSEYPSAIARLPEYRSAHSLYRY